MTSRQIFRETTPFCIEKLKIGAITVALSSVVFLFLTGIGWLFGGNGLWLTWIIWILATRLIKTILMHYMGYLVKAGHIAVIVETMKTGSVPDNQLEYGKALVKQRFLTSNIYFVLDRLISDAVKQIQKGIQSLGNHLDFIPGIGAVTGLANLFVDISLGYVDECCFGWTFYNSEQSAYQSAADGVVIYAQNWKLLLKHAASVMAKVAVALLSTVIFIFVPVGSFFKLFHLSSTIAFILSCLLTWIVKFSFIDNYIMCQMMVTYMEAAPHTEITFDLYGKLCNISTSFKELFQRGREEIVI